MTSEDLEYSINYVLTFTFFWSLQTAIGKHVNNIFPYILHNGRN